MDSSAKPRTALTNRARLISHDNQAVTEFATDTIKVLADPDFDQGMLIGRVFCDKNRNGKQESTEAGVAGVQLYMDHGYQTTTDRNGLFHFKDIDPGTHRVKLDMNSVLPGSELTTSEGRTISFTRGLPVRVLFGLTCPTKMVETSAVEITDQGLAHQLRGEGTTRVDVSFDPQTLELSWDGRSWRPPTVGVKHELGDAQEQSNDSGQPVVFRPQIGSGPWMSWRLRAWGPQEQSVIVATGEALPPRIDWRLPTTWVGSPWSYQLDVFGANGIRVGSTRRRVEGPAKPTLIARLSADGVDTSGSFSEGLKKTVEALIPRLKQLKGIVLVQGHHDNSKSPLRARSLSRRRAKFVADF